MTLRMQTYMEKHKIAPLFEDLMNKVLRDLPDDPHVYILRAVYKKAGLDIPQDIRFGGMRRSTTDFSRGRSRSPDKHQNLSSTDPNIGNRDYNRPWNSPGKRMKPKKSSDEAELSRSRRQKPDWNNDVKSKPTATTSLDELWDDPSPNKRDEPRRSEPSGIMKKSWAKVGLDNVDNVVYSSGKYTGPRRTRFESEVELLAAENVVASRSRVVKGVPSVGRSSVKHKSSAAQHRRDLEKLLRESEKRCDESGYGDDMDDVEDEAIELLENADDLLREGVTNIPKSGYKLSKIMKQRQEEATIKLNINLYPQPEPSPSIQGDPYGDMPEYGNYDSEREYRPRTGSPSGAESDDEFESVSQVTGQRRPVWNAPDSDVESYIPRPAFSTPQPRRSKGRPPHGSRNLSSTMPDTYRVHSPRMTGQDVEDFTRNPSRSWSSEQRVVSPDEPGEVRESLQSARGGWMMPDDSDASVTEFSYKAGGRDARAY